jgi:hypothetical protein
LRVVGGAVHNLWLRDLRSVLFTIYAQAFHVLSPELLFE